jgi:hypothetical protein
MGRGASDVSGIYLVDRDGRLITMAERPYATEDHLQNLIAVHPQVMAGDQFDSATPRRWLLVAREAPVPDEMGGQGRWLLDHLFLDQDGIVTLVEVKRSSDTRIRRAVVGQMFDYAANARAFWPATEIRAMFERRCLNERVDAEAVLHEHLGEAGDNEAFWDAVQANIDDRRLRLIFIADEIPLELQRIVEFLNEQMELTLLSEEGTKVGFYGDSARYHEIAEQCRGKLFLNFDDEVFNQDMRRYLEERFPSPSMYEKGGLRPGRAS